MIRFRFIVTAMILLAAGILLSGCSDEDSITNSSGTAPVVISISPQDGAIDVPTSGSIVLKFNTPMDTMSVIENFHCVGGDEMWEWMDSLQHHGMGSGGNMGDMDHMMDWMEDIEHTGDFHWNEDMTECDFHLDGGFTTHTDYMMYLEGELLSQGGMMMDMHHMQYDGLMIHFRTGP